MKRTTLSIVIIWLFLASVSGASAQQRKNPTPLAPKPTDDLKKLIGRLALEDSAERGAAIAELITKNLGQQAAPAVPYLILALEDNKRIMLLGGQSEFSGRLITPATLALEALKGIGQPAIDGLIAALKAKDLSIRKFAAEALGEIKASSAVGPLITVLQDKFQTGASDPYFVSSFIRSAAATALGKIKDPRAVEPLIVELRTKDQNYFNNRVRSDVAAALGEIEDARAIETLIASLSDEDIVVRSNSAGALGKIKDSRAVEPLLTSLSDKVIGMRESSVNALAEIGDTRAIEPMIAAWAKEDPDSSIDMNYRTALTKITRQHFDTLKEWREWWEQNKERFKKNR